MAPAASAPASSNPISRAPMAPQTSRVAESGSAPVSVMPGMGNGAGGLAAILAAKRAAADANESSAASTPNGSPGSSRPGSGLGGCSFLSCFIETHLLTHRHCREADGTRPRQEASPRRQAQADGASQTVPRRRTSCSCPSRLLGSRRSSRSRSRWSRSSRTPSTTVWRCTSAPRSRNFALAGSSRSGSRTAESFRRWRSTCAPSERRPAETGRRRGATAEPGGPSSNDCSQEGESGIVRVCNRSTTKDN